MEEKTMENFHSLVRYNNPSLVVKHPEKTASGESARFGAGAGDKSSRPLSAGIPDSRKETEEILNAILPPRVWEENGQLWTQTVSSTPATRQDVINLQEMLDIRLTQLQARETGICPVRRELYVECFDEIIRQVTINCVERGLLLLRVRDEITMSMESYETLYSSSVAFGIRKALQMQEGKESLLEKAKALEIEKAALEEQINDMKLKTEQSDRRNAELRASEEKKYSEEVQFLKKTNAQLKAQLEGITCPKK